MIINSDVASSTVSSFKYLFSSLNVSVCKCLETTKLVLSIVPNSRPQSLYGHAALSYPPFSPFGLSVMADSPSSVILNIQ